jgi:hypothetical protein
MPPAAPALIEELPHAKRGPRECNTSVRRQAINRRNFMIMPISSSVAAQSIDRATFEDLYVRPRPGTSASRRGGVAIADCITSPVLAAGCGMGEHAPFHCEQGEVV